MCGRTVCMRDGHTLTRRCRYRGQNGKMTTPNWVTPPGGQAYQPSYNVAPGAHTPVLYGKPDSTRALQPMLWGLIPAWHRGTAKDFGYKMNNCRSETMQTTASFKTPLQRGQRCVVLADGFYEWKRESSGKQPFFIYMPKNTFNDIKDDLVSDPESLDHEFASSESHIPIADYSNHDLLKMAGLYDKWTSPEGNIIYSYTVITVPSSPSISAIHHRMPAIFTNSESIDIWLSSDIPVDKVVSVINSTESLAFHPVASAVNNSRYNHPDCILKAEERKPKPSPAANFMKNWLKSASPKKDENKMAAVKRHDQQETKENVAIKRKFCDISKDEDGKLKIPNDNNI